jgi:hypothetical protein
MRSAALRQLTTDEFYGPGQPSLESPARCRRRALEDGATIPELERDATVQGLLERSPQIRGARAATERARAVVWSAQRQTVPNLFLRGGMQHTLSYSSWRVSVSVPMARSSARSAPGTTDLRHRQGGVRSPTASLGCPDSGPHVLHTRVLKNAILCRCLLRKKMVAGGGFEPPTFGL